MNLKDKQAVPYREAIEGTRKLLRQESLGEFIRSALYDATLAKLPPPGEEGPAVVTLATEKRWPEAIGAADELMEQLLTSGNYTESAQVASALLAQIPEEAESEPLRMRIRVYRMCCRRETEGVRATLREAADIVLSTLGQPDTFSAAVCRDSPTYRAVVRRIRKAGVPSLLRAAAERTGAETLWLNAVSFAATQLASSLTYPGEFSLAREILETACSISQRTHDAIGELRALCHLAAIEVGEENYEKAHHYLDCAEEIGQHIGNGQEKANLLYVRAYLAHSQDRHPRPVTVKDYRIAARNVEEALNLYEEIDDLPGKARALLLAARIALQDGTRIEEATLLAEEADDIAEQSDSLLLKTSSLFVLAHVCYGQDGNSERALRVLKEAGVLHSKVGNVQGYAAALAWSGIWAAEAGNVALAEQCLEDVCFRLERIGDGPKASRLRVALGQRIVAHAPVRGLRMLYQGTDDLIASEDPDAELLRDAFRGVSELTLTALEFQQGVCALLAGLPSEAIAPLLAAGQKFTDQDRLPEATQAIWALSKALSLAGQTDRAAVYATQAKAAADELNLYLPEYPDGNPSAAQQRRRISLSLREISEVMTDPEILTDELGVLVSLLTALSDPPKDQAELIVRELFHNGETVMLRKVMPELLGMLSQDPSGKLLETALRDELRRMVGTLQREAEKECPEGIPPEVQEELSAILRTAQE